MSNAAQTPGSPARVFCAVGWRRDAPPGNYVANHAVGTLAVSPDLAWRAGLLERHRRAARLDPRRGDHGRGCRDRFGQPPLENRPDPAEEHREVLVVVDVAPLHRRPVSLEDRL